LYFVEKTQYKSKQYLDTENICRNDMCVVFFGELWQQSLN